MCNKVVLFTVTQVPIITSKFSLKNNMLVVWEINFNKTTVTSVAWLLDKSHILFTKTYFLDNYLSIIGTCHYTIASEDLQNLAFNDRMSLVIRKQFALFKDTFHP